MRQICVHSGSMNSYTVASSGSGISDTARILFNKLKKEISDIAELVTKGPSLTSDALIATYKDCSSENWDGYGAKPVSIDSVNEAREFISRLPSIFPMPEIVAEPSGEIGLEWYKDKNKLFALSFNGRKIIAYAGIFGSNKTHGVEYFENSIPSIIIDSLKRLYF